MTTGNIAKVVSGNVFPNAKVSLIHFRGGMWYVQCVESPVPIKGAPFSWIAEQSLMVVNTASNLQSLFSFQAPAPGQKKFSPH